MQTPTRVALAAFAAIFAMLAGGAYAQYIVKSGSEPYKLGRKFDEDGNPIIPGKRFQRSGANIDHNILQPGKRFEKPGREIEEGTYDWDKAPSKPRHALNEETGKHKKKSKRKPVED